MLMNLSQKECIMSKASPSILPPMKAVEDDSLAFAGQTALPSR